MGCVEGASLYEFRLMVVEVTLSPSMPASMLRIMAVFPVPARMHLQSNVVEKTPLQNSSISHHLACRELLCMRF